MGAQLFNDTCSRCHGQDAVGGQKDLRFMSRETHDNFETIVLEGTLVEKGMASFADILDAGEVNAIHAYLIARANESWGNNRDLPEE